ncbi:hypothetical protein CYMTET_18771 [Cymbomonas tetramitiformis]|uniref:Ferric reductase NAD binding domain-containing protein n=1 Tax=Cymbomonas tetramitiformis TaxID=36881 RepID=A0AAE0G7L1_9CHLO|nr:hypothetical protein CYMTET_18771 [Cymbomonas tetramitiformis]
MNEQLVMGTTFASQLSRINNVNAINSDVEGGAARYDPLYTEFYLTRVRPDEAEQKLANIDPKLQSCLRFGRPKLEEIFKEMHQLCKTHGDKHCAVLVCGPDAMIHDARMLCPAWSTDGVKFEFHSETFDY